MLDTNTHYQKFSFLLPSKGKIFYSPHISVVVLRSSAPVLLTAGCREDKADHESREKNSGTDMAVAERSSFALIKTNG